MRPAYDIGIDFVCELLKNDSLSSVFFGVQAKGTRHFGERWRGSFKKSTVAEWLLQPFPIYLIVYDEADKNYYWKSISDAQAYLTEKLKTSNKRIQITVSKSILNSLSDNKGENRLIRKIHEDSRTIGLMRGYPRFIGEGYIKRVPLLSLPEGVIDNIKENIRISILCLINNYLLKGDMNNSYLLCEFLTRLDKSHYDHFLMFGRMNRFVGNKQLAKKSFEEAIEICRRDKNWNTLKKPSDPSIEEVISSIEKEIESL